MPRAKKDSFPKFKSVLYIGAHPDDPDFGAAGTMARFVDEGACVRIVIVTDGSEGGEDPSVPDKELTEIRYQEQSDAARVLGVQEVVFLGYPDGRVSHTIDLRRDLTRQIRKHKPELVLTHTPVINLDARIGGYHADHLAVGQATLAAVYPGARNPRAFRELADEGLEAWTVKEVWIPFWTQGDFRVDITTTIDRKLKALEEHRSQFKNWKNWKRDMRKRHAEIGKKPGFKYAESFKRIETG
jgi:LmbE family N-acetylglucosaminyl deacetylase